MDIVANGKYAGNQQIIFFLSYFQFPYFFLTLKDKTSKNIVGNGKYAGKQHILLFLKYFFNQNCFYPIKSKSSFVIIPRFNNFEKEGLQSMSNNFSPFLKIFCMLSKRAFQHFRSNLLCRCFQFGQVY